MQLLRTGPRRRAAMGLAGAVTGAVVLGAAPPAAAVPPGFETVLIDRTTSGTPASNGPSTRPAVSQSALLVAFQSAATDLVILDTNGARDVFVKHRGTGVLTRVSVSSTGVQANGDSQLPSIDGTGAYIAFESFASNLVPGDVNGARDVFLRHTPSGTTTLISRAGGGQGNADSGNPVISGNGRFIAFTSSAGNLVAGDTNNALDVFVADRVTGAVARVSVRTDGGQGNDGSFQPAISLDGRYVAYTSRATNLVSSDTNGAQDVFVHDRQTGTVTRASVHSNGRQADGDSTGPAIALRGDGYVVAFMSTATTLVGNDTNGVADVYVQTSQPRRTVRASVSSAGAQSNGSSSHPALSGADITTGSQYVAFSSAGSNLVAGDSNGDDDVFRYDLATGQTRRFSVGTGGHQGSGGDGAFQPAIDRAGHTVAYSADFADFVPGDGANTENIFVTVDHGGA